MYCMSNIAFHIMMIKSTDRAISWYLHAELLYGMANAKVYCNYDKLDI